MRKSLLGLLLMATILVSQVQAEPFVASSGMNALDQIGRPSFTDPARPLNTPLTSVEFRTAPLQSSWDAFTLVTPDASHYDATERMFYIVDRARRGVMSYRLPVGLPFTRANLQYVGTLGQKDQFSADIGANVGTACTGQAGINACNFGASLGAMTTFSHGGSRYLGVPDPGRHRVLFFDVTGGSVTSGEAAVWVLGQTNFTSGGGEPDCTFLATTQGSACAVTGASMVYAADGALLVGGNNDRVSVFALSDFLTTRAAVKVFGHPGFGFTAEPHFCGGAIAPVVAGEMPTVDACVTYGPAGAHWSASEHVLLVQTQGRINGYNLSGSLLNGITNGMSTDFVIGKPSATSPLVATDVAIDSTNITYPTSSFALDEVGHRLFAQELCGVRVYEYGSNGVASLGNGAKAISAMLGDAPAFYRTLNPALVNVPQQYICDRSTFTFGANTINVTEQLATRSTVTIGPINWIGSENRLVVSDLWNARLMIFGGGVAPNTQGGNTTVTPNPDGTTTLIVTTGPQTFTVQLPSGATLPSGNGVLVNQGPSGANHPSISMNYTLPPGTTKTVTMPYTNDALCIVDAAQASVTTQGSCSGVKIRKQDLPAAGQCINWRASDQVCRSSAGTSLTVSGLAHSALYYMVDQDNDGVDDDNDRCPNTDLNGPIPTQQLRPNHIGDATVLEDGCNCSQVLEGLNINGNGPRKFGCTPGHINQWLSN